MMSKILEKISGKWIFLTIVIILYLVLLFTNSTLFKEVLIKFFHLLQSIVPIIVLVFILTFLSNLFLDVKKITKFFGKEAGIKGWLMAIITGILSTGPIYMWYPVLKDLKEKGMEDSFITAFLYNRAVKIPLLPMMIYYFGLSFTLILTFYMILFSIINGVLVGKILKFKNYTKIIQNSL